MRSVASLATLWLRFAPRKLNASLCCGWLVDRYGLSWQVIPTVLGKLMGDSDPGRAGRAVQAMMGMVKLDIAELERAANG